MMVSVMEPDKFIPKHRGDYKGILRYHIALDVPPATATPARLREHVTPYDTRSGTDLYLAVSTRRYITSGMVMPYTFLEWQEGEDLLFDDTFVHYAENTRTAHRAVLFTDIPRHDMPPWLSWINEFLIRHVIAVLVPRVQAMVEKSTPPI